MTTQALDRAEIARAALARAEERTGTTRWSRRPARPRPASADGVAAPGAVPAVGGVAAPGAVPAPDGVAAPGGLPAPGGHPDEGAVRHRRSHEVTGTGDRSLPVDGDLAHLLPLGALPRGSTLAVTGSTSLVLGLLAEASRTGAWVALVGLPGAGVLAAAQLGLDLTRLVLVPAPGPDAARVVAALLDGVDAVVVGPQAALLDGDRRRLAARARERSAVLVATTPWPGAGVTLTAGDAAWEGLGRGHGRLRRRVLTVERTGRGAAAAPWRGVVALPADGTPGPATAPSPVRALEVLPGWAELEQVG